MKTLLIILILLLPSTLYHHKATVPCTIEDTVKTSDYVEYWKARIYHGDYFTWKDKGKWWFERDGHIIEFKRGK